MTAMTDTRRAPEPPDEPDETDAWEEYEMACGMDRDGQCSQAGTEYCDFECPFRD